MTRAALTPGVAIAVAWLVWALSWLAAAAWSRPTVSRASYGRELPNRLVTVIGGVLLFASMSWRRSLAPVEWRVDPALGWILFACALAGMAFAWWARLSLGTLWSGTVTRKEDHRVVDTGPYALVRHPIYTGILFALWATAVETGRVEPVLGVALVSLGLWMKARLEEGFLAEELGVDAYAGYRARVPMLIPFSKGRAA